MSIPYAHNDGNLKDLLVNKIPNANVPPKFNQITLESLGYKSKNDRPILKVLKFLEIVDNNGVPTQVYRDLRDSTRAKKVLASQIRKAYEVLYETFSDAHKRDNEAIANVIRSRTDSSSSTVSMVVSTFKALCEIADFDNGLEDYNPEPNTGDGNGEKVYIGETRQNKNGQSPLILNVNIQLTLPETKDYEVYEKLFESLRKNILDRK